MGLEDELVLFKESVLHRDGFEFDNYVSLNTSLYSRGDERLVVQEDLRDYLSVVESFKRYKGFDANPDYGFVSLQLDLFDTEYF